jgi:hypothetical protein
VGASNRAANVKANNHALGNLLKTDHADASKLIAGATSLRLCKIRSSMFGPRWASLPMSSRANKERWIHSDAVAS